VATVSTNSDGVTGTLVAVGDGTANVTAVLTYTDASGKTQSLTSAALAVTVVSSAIASITIVPGTAFTTPAAAAPAPAATAAAPAA
jgi:hypothetical protein